MSLRSVCWVVRERQSHHDVAIPRGTCAPSRTRHAVSLRRHSHKCVQNPTQDEREALEAYMHLTSRLYPCGECAAEFQALLKTYPPQVRASVVCDGAGRLISFTQTASRLSASLWYALSRFLSFCHGTAVERGCAIGCVHCTTRSMLGLES